MSESRDMLLIGVDGGGTGCRVALADAHQAVLAEAEGGCANVATDFAAAIRNVKATTVPSTGAGAKSSRVPE